MADNVNIIGIGNLDEWASEESLQELLAVFKKFADISEKDAEVIRKSIEDGNDESGELNSILGSFSKGQEKSNKKNEKFQSDQKKDTAKKSKKPSALVKTLQSSLDNVLPDNKIFKHFNKSITDSVAKVDLFSATVITASTSLLSGFVTSSVNVLSSYTDMYKSGVMVAAQQVGAAGRLEVFATAAETANVSMADLADISKNYSTVINTVGIKSFSEAAKEVTKTGHQFGLTASESTKFLAEWTEQERIRGTLGDITTAKEQKRAKESLAITTGFAQALGKSTEELQKQNLASAKSVDMQAAIANVPEELKAGMATVLNSLEGDAKTAMTELLQVSVGLEQGTESWQKFAKTGAVEGGNILVDFAQRVKRGEIEGANLQSELAKAMAGSASAVERMEPVMQAMIDGGNRMAIEVLGGARNMAAFAKQLEEQGKPKKDPIAEGQAKVNDALTALANTWDRIVGNLIGTNSDEIVEMIGKIGKIAGDLLPKLFSLVSTFAKIIGPVFDIIINIFSGFADVLSGALDIVEGDLSITKWLSDMFGFLSSQSVVAFLAIKTGFGSFIKDLLVNLKGIFSPSGSGFFGKFFGMFKSVGKLFLGFLTKIPGVGAVIGGFFGMLEGIFSVLSGETEGIGEALSVIFMKTLEGIIDGFLAIPMLIVKAIDALFGTKVEDFINDVVFKGVTDGLMSLGEAFMNPLDTIANLFSSDSDDGEKEVRTTRRQQRAARSKEPPRSSIVPQIPVVPALAAEQTSTGNTPASQNNTINSNDALALELAKLRESFDENTLATKENAMYAKKTARNTGENKSGII